MKIKSLIILLHFLSVLFLNALFPQQVITWQNHTSYRGVCQILDLDTSVMLSTHGGLASINTSTFQVWYWNKSNSGLNSDQILCLERDSTGAVWIGTDCGLTIWYGNTWTNYTPQNSALTTSTVTSLRYSKDVEAMFVGLDDGNVIRIDSAGWNFITGNTILHPQSGVYSLAIASSGHVWAATHSYGVYHFDGTDWQVFNSSNAGLVNHIGGVAIDSSGMVWISNIIKLSKYNGTAWTHYFAGPLAPGGFSHVSVGPDQKIWISTVSGLISFNGVNFAAHPANSLLTNAFIQYHLVRKNLTAWTAPQYYGTDYIQGTVVTNFPLTPGLCSGEIRDLDFEKSSHRVWCANGWAGKKVFAAMYNDTIWENITPQNSPIDTAIISAIAVDTNFTVYLGTETEGLYVLQGNNWTHFTGSNSNMSMDHISALAIDKNNHLLLGYYYGMVQLMDSVNFITLIQTPAIHNKINHIEPINSNAFWVATDTSGMLWCNYSSFNVLNTNNTGIPSNHVEDIISTGIGQCWIATDQGLAFLNGSNWTVFNTLNSGLPEDHVTSITIAHDSDIWIGTYQSGVAVFDGNSWSTYNECNSPLCCNDINVIGTGPDGRIYIGTQDGLNIVKIDNIIEVPARPESVSVRVYPNPATKFIRFEISLSYPSVIELSIFNSLTQRIYHKTMIGSKSGSMVLEVDFTNLSNPFPSGVYFYHLGGNFNPVSGKMVVLKN